MKKLTFKKNPQGFAYTAPNTYEVPDALAAEFVAAGVADESSPVLPAKFPARKKLIAAGLESIDDIRAAIDTLADPFTAKEIEAIKAELSK